MEENFAQWYLRRGNMQLQLSVFGPSTGDLCEGEVGTTARIISRCREKRGMLSCRQGTPLIIEPNAAGLHLALNNSWQRHVVASEPTLLAVYMTSRIKLPNSAALRTRSTAAAIRLRLSMGATEGDDVHELKHQEAPQPRAQFLGRPRQPRSRQQSDGISFHFSTRRLVMAIHVTRSARFQGSDRSSSRFGPDVILNAEDDTV